MLLPVGPKSVVTLVVACVCGWAAASANAYVYWSNFAGSTVGRAGLDGAAANEGFVAAPQAAGVAVDGQFVYWANDATNTIGRANLDGSSPNQNFITGLSEPSGVAVDADHVYWTNEGTNSIGRANLDGSVPNPNFIPGANEPEGVAVNSTNIYWVNHGNGTIGRAPLTVSPRPRASSPAWTAPMVSPSTPATSTGPTSATDRSAALLSEAGRRTTTSSAV